MPPEYEDGPCADADLLQAALDVVRDLIPGFEPDVSQHEEFSRFSLPVPPGADYRFEVYCYPSGEPQITSSLLSDPDSYSWYYAFEIEDFSSQAEQREVFLTELGRLLQSPTRIEMRQGFFMRSLRCLLEAPEAAAFGTHTSLLKLSLKTARATYRSAAVAPKESTLSAG